MTSSTAPAAAMRPELLLTVAAMHGIATLAFLRVFRRQLTSPGEGLHWTNPVRLAVLVVGGTLALVFCRALATVPAFAAALAGALSAWWMHPALDQLGAWLSLRVRRPFRIGDQIRIPRWNLGGTVLRIGMRHIELAPRQGAATTWDFGGRTILIPLALLRQECLVNESLHQTPGFALEEVSLRLSRDSDQPQAEQALLEVAEALAGGVSRRTGMPPQIRVFPDAYGTRLALRLLLPAGTERSMVRHGVSRIAGALAECSAVLPTLFWVHTHHAGIRSLRPSARAKRNGTAIPPQNPTNAALGEPTCP